MSHDDAHGAEQRKLVELMEGMPIGMLTTYAPEDPNAVMLRLDVEQAEYGDTPGGKVASLLSFAKAKLTGDTLDADHGTVEP
ncbi:pyridoxamine 5'-phosphate oxidase family protein [Nocardioides sp. zg-ZUI104]|uniref:pyridoxamine 5'-phosphate oxidase family protein n=1 Tax=Nocardioides faecalis TaxID=2803858 RepID=UPI001BCB17EB|nr:pyridoxamine 5'-phosphate oxidase family protein [Nocardioides faecalis]MBS4753508.1 pyridoxamine 5'-phosphate oxidase family protein [Nocardioides faecalis]